MGSFNFGMDQDMLRSRKQKTVDKHCRNFGRVCGKLVEEGELDIMFGCEVGGARQGFRCEMINVKDILREPFGDISVAEVDNYIAICRFRKSSVVLHGSPEKVELAGTNRDVDAVITRFDVFWSTFDTGGAAQPAAHIVAANLHIVCGEKNAPTTTTRQRIVQLLRDQLERCTAPDPQRLHTASKQLRPQRRRPPLRLFLRALSARRNHLYR